MSKIVELRKKSLVDLEKVVVKNQARLQELAREKANRKQGDNIRERKNLKLEIARAKTLIKANKDEE